jgi:hypothetical protein
MQLNLNDAVDDAAVSPASISPRVKAFVQLLADFPAMPSVCNPWSDADMNVDYDLNFAAAGVRRAQLQAYLNERVHRATTVLIAEAPGYQGARFSGMAMTSERIVLGNHASVQSHHVLMQGAGIPARTSRTDIARAGAQGMNEPTATVVWSHLLQAGFDARSFVLWNTFAFHPYQADNLMSNRTPTPNEIALAAPLLHSFLALFSHCRVVALGKIAHAAMYKLGIDALSVRHPSMGGATQFRAHMQVLKTM